MLEAVLDFVLQNSGQTSISVITLICVMYSNKQLKKHGMQIGLHSEGMVIQMRQVLSEIYKRSAKTRTVSDYDWKIWNETYGVYTKLGGNGVATGWNKDINKWRS